MAGRTARWRSRRDRSWLRGGPSSSPARRRSRRRHRPARPAGPSARSSPFRRQPPRRILAHPRSSAEDLASSASRCAPTPVETVGPTARCLGDTGVGDHHDDRGSRGGARPAVSVRMDVGAAPPIPATLNRPVTPAPARRATMTTTETTWPTLPVAEWVETRDTLQLWMQIVGKVRMVSTPLMSHWWNVPLYVTSRGLTTSLIPRGDRAFQIDFDLLADRLDISVTDGTIASVPLTSGPVAGFYAHLMDQLDGLGLHTEMWTMPVELPDAIPFEHDRTHTTYDGDQARRFWRLLIQASRVFEVFRSRYVGKVSP